MLVIRDIDNFIKTITLRYKINLRKKILKLWIKKEWYFANLKIKQKNIYKLTLKIRQLTLLL